MRAHCAIRDEVMRGGVGHSGGEQIARPCWYVGSVDMHQAAIAGASGQAPVGGVLLADAGTHQHLDIGTDQLLVLVPADLLFNLDQAVVAFLHDGLGNLIRHRRRRRARTWRVLEGEGTGESGPLDNVEGLHEVGFGLTREPDDDVCRDGRIGHRRPDVIDDGQVPGLTI